MPVPAGFSEVTLHHSTPAGIGVRDSVVTFGIEGVPVQANGILININWIDNVWSVLGSDQSTFKGCTLRDETAVWEEAANSAGGQSGPLTDPQVSLLVRKRTAVAGRKNRGRMYPPSQAYNDTYNAGGVMSAPNVATYQAAYDDFLDAMTADGIPMVILHGGDTILSPTTVTSLQVDNLSATQRRRTGR